LALLKQSTQVDPIRDLETIQSELCLKDVETMNKVLDNEKNRIRKEKGLARAADPPLSETFQTAYDKVIDLLNSNTPVQTHEDFSMGEVDCIRDWQLLTTKPQVYVINMDQKSFIRKGNKWLPKINKWVNSHGGGQIIPMSMDFEQNLQDLAEDKDAQNAFLKDCTDQAKAFGITNPNLMPKSVIPKLIRSGRIALCLQSFYTAGPKEVRAWTIQKGCLAPQAAGVIHTDFEKGFIKAEVCSFDDFKALHQGQPSMAKIKEAGKYRQEGKTYLMQDGDICHFMFNVGSKKK